MTDCIRGGQVCDSVSVTCSAPASVTAILAVQSRPIVLCVETMFFVSQTILSRERLVCVAHVCCLQIARRGQKDFVAHPNTILQSREEGRLFIHSFERKDLVGVSSIFQIDRFLYSVLYFGRVYILLDTSHRHITVLPVVVSTQHDVCHIHVQLREGFLTRLARVVGVCLE